MAISDNPNLKPIITSPSQDILHAWPGTLIPLLKWIQVDPTWGVLPFDYFNKLDFNHQLVIHGQDPEYPYSRWWLQGCRSKSKDIEIEPIEEISFPKILLTPNL